MEINNKAPLSKGNTNEHTLNASEASNVEVMNFAILNSVPIINNIGDENSFLNSIIHLFYFIPEIFPYLEKNKLNFVEGKKNYHILLELYEILKKYNELLDFDKCIKIPQEKRYINVDKLRNVISELYKGEGFFKVNQIEEPSKLLYVFLNSIHSFSIKLDSPKYYILQNYKENNSLDNKGYDDLNQTDVLNECSPKCISHKLFSYHLVQQVECQNCFSSGNIKKFPSNFYIFEIKYKNIYSIIKGVQKVEGFSNSFFRLAKRQIQFSEGQRPSNCKCKVPSLINKNYVIEPSEYYNFNISWEEIIPNFVDVCQFFNILPRIFKNGDFFDLLSKNDVYPYLLYGLICYFNGQYISFYMNEYKEWFFFQDMNTYKIKAWIDIIKLCVINHYLPVMLFYKKGIKSTLGPDKVSIIEIEELMKYCNNLDKETLEKISSSNQENGHLKNLYNKMLIRPTVKVNKVNEGSLIKNLKNYQILEENKEKKKKMRHLEEMEKDIDERGSEGINIFAGKWICELCHNHNYFSNYQCSKCREINTKVYEILYNTITR